MNHKKLFFLLHTSASFILVLGLALAGSLSGSMTQIARAAGRPNTIPALREWTDGTGSYTFSSASRIVYNGAGLAGDAATFADDLFQMSGFTIPTVNGTSSNPGDIYLTLGATDPAIGPEGYLLTIGSSVTISAQANAGAFYGTRTILQLLKQSYTIAAGTSRDWPSYPQRGMMVDNGRKYFTVSWLQNHVKDLAYLKLNYFHLHISDNLGFRLESTSHPEIVSAQHYTKAEIQTLLALAAKYHVTITPEIDMPGHMDAMLASHPELQLTNSSGQKDAGKIDLSLAAAYTFMNDILQEYLPLFTGLYWHVGADEYLSDYTPYPQMLTYAQAHYGASANAKDTYLGFVNWVDGVVRAQGKTLRMWNDGIGGGAVVTVNADIVVEHWTGGPSPQSLINGGHFLMNSTGDYLYYVLGNSWKPNNTTLYENWEPHIFQGNQTIAAYDPKNYGAKLQVWCDNPNAETEDQVAIGIKNTLRSVAQKTWATTKLVTTYAAFTPIISAIGRAPGTTFNDGVLSGDLALGKPATVSSVETGTSFTGNLAVDGDYSTRWSSAYTDPQWIYVDLGQTYTINHVKLNWETAYGKAYQIQVSNDATNWTSIYSTTTGDGGVDDLTGLSGSGRYVRMYGTARATTWGYSIWEFEVYGSGGGATATPTRTNTPAPPTATPTKTNTPVPGGNVALNRPVTASSVESGTSFTANLAVDGSTATRWSSDRSDPQWIYVDLGQTYSVNHVKLNWETAYGKAYQIQVSNDATNWTTIYSTTTSDGGIDDLTGLVGSGRYVRMYGTVRATVYGYSLWEFEVYGSIDLAFNKPATASSTYSTYTAGKAVDNNSATWWWSNGPAPQTIYVDLGSALSISHVRLLWGTGDYATAYQIQTKVNATDAWTTQLSVSGATGGQQNHTFAAVSARYVQLNITTSPGPNVNWIQLYNFEVYSN